MNIKLAFLIVLCSLLVSCGTTTPQGRARMYRGFSDIISLGGYSRVQERKQEQALKAKMQQLKIQEQELRNQRLRRNLPDATYKVVIE